VSAVTEIESRTPRRSRGLETRCCGSEPSTARLFQTITLGLALFFAAWGSWLLLSDDPDGGAHAGGWFMLGVAVVLALPTALLLRRQAHGGQAEATTMGRSAFMGVAAAVGIAALLLLLFGTP
jgi:hypothetical protein